MLKAASKVLYLVDCLDEWSADLTVAVMAELKVGSLVASLVEQTAGQWAVW